MRAIWASLLVLCLSACGAAPASGPSAAIETMRDRFEAEVLAIEKDHGDDAPALQRAAAAIAEKVYGADWNVVRAEAKRSVAALPKIDLSPYEAATPLPSRIDQSVARDMAMFMTPGGLASIRFWDAQTVGYVVAPIASDLTRGAESPAMIGMKIGLAPPRVWGGKFKGEDVIAIRHMRAMVLVPYTFSAEGMILPTFASVRVFDLQPAKAAQ